VRRPGQTGPEPLEKVDGSNLSPPDWGRFLWRPYFGCLRWSAAFSASACWIVLVIPAASSSSNCGLDVAYGSSRSIAGFSCKTAFNSEL
jgi:hypothetical protein